MDDGSAVWWPTPPHRMSSPSTEDSVWSTLQFCAAATAAANHCRSNDGSSGAPLGGGCYGGRAPDRPKLQGGQLGTWHSGSDSGIPVARRFLGEQQSLMACAPAPVKTVVKVEDMEDTEARRGAVAKVAPFVPPVR